MNSTTTHYLLDAIERASLAYLSTMDTFEKDPKSQQDNGVGIILRESIEQGKQDYDMLQGWLARSRATKET